MPGDADQKLCIIGVGDVGSEDRVVGCFLAQLVSFASEYPYQRVEPEKRRRNARQEQLHPVHAGDVRELMGDDRLGFARRLNRTGIENDHWPHQAPADR